MTYENNLAEAIAQVSLWIKHGQPVRYRDVSQRFRLGKDNTDTALTRGRELASAKMTKGMVWPVRIGEYQEWRR